MIQTHTAHSCIEITILTFSIPAYNMLSSQQQVESSEDSSQQHLDILLRTLLYCKVSQSMVHGKFAGRIVSAI